MEEAYNKDPNNPEYIWTSIHDTDGYFTENIGSNLFNQNPNFYKNFAVLRLLLEAKYQEDFQVAYVRCQTLLQAVYYLKKFELAGDPKPNVVLIGDINECFVVAGSTLDRYLKENLDWNIAPSSAGTAPENQKFVLQMVDDTGITPFVYEVSDPRVDLNLVLSTINLYAQGTRLYKIQVNEHNIRLAYDRFINSVIRVNAKKFEPDELVSIFIQSLIAPNKCYLVPNTVNKLHLANGKEITVDSHAYVAFFGMYEKSYTPREKRIFTEVADRLIEETKRRFHGDFWTPSAWADQAHKELDKLYGSDWREKFVIWDSSCGSKNLTRDYSFNELYLSTLHQSELDISQSYNPSSIAFQMDFLNDDIDMNPNTDPDTLIKVPKELFNALKADKPVLFLGNPPYATANEAGAKGKSKQGVAKTAVSKIMRNEDAGSASQQLLAQFIWRIVKLKKDFNLSNCVIAFFINPIFFSPSPYWANFRKNIFSNFGFKFGFIFPAGDFADVSSNWGVGFIVLDSHETQVDIWDENIPHSWKFDALYLNENGNITKLGEKRLFHWPEKYSLSFWIREPIKALRPARVDWDCAQLSSGLKCSFAKGKPSGNLLKDSIGYMVNVANNVYNSSTDTWIVSSSAYKGHGVNVTPENFERTVVNFAVRHLVKDNWLVHIDEYHIPDVSLDGYQEFLEDSVIFSLFSSRSNQTSVKDLEGPNGLVFSFDNQWFPWSKDEMKVLANKYNQDDMYNTIISDKERFVHEWLKKHTRSKEAQKVLDLAFEVIKETFPLRAANPTFSSKEGCLDLHLNRWDAGWYQINFLIKQAKQEKNPKVIAFKKAYGFLASKLRKQICNFGFLKDKFGHFTANPQNQNSEELEQ